MTPSEALAVIKAQPLTLSTGQPLQDWLARTTSLGPNRAPVAIREYQRFLALALSAAPGEITVPGPMIAQLWQLHRDDAAAYARFAAPKGAALSHHSGHTSMLLTQTTGSRYSAAFGPAPRRWWPSHWMLALHITAPAAVLLLSVAMSLFATLVLRWNVSHPLLWSFAPWLAALITLALIEKLVPRRFRIFGPNPTAFAQGPS